MRTEILDLLPVLALLASGSAALALEPRNRASQLLALAGAGGLISSLLTPLAGRDDEATVSAVIVRLAGELGFLVAVASLAAMLLVFPDGRLQRAWHRYVGQGLLGLAVAAPFLLLLGRHRVVGEGEDDTAVTNVLAVPGLRVLGTVGQVVHDLEPAWLVVGLVFLALRYRGTDAAQRRSLRPLLVTLGALGVLLVLVIAEEIFGVTYPQPAFEVLFVVVLSGVPLALLAGISQRSRGLTAELAASRGRLLSAEDDARQRLERDLHDGVQQQLVALLSLSSLASRQARTGNPALTATLEDVQSQLTETIEELRELVNGIRPPALTDSGVAAALESRMRRMPPEVTMDVAGLRERRWPTETESAAYFVACEAVANALKHAPGAPVRVRLVEHSGGLEVEVADEGPGLPAGPTTGSGLTGLHDRVDSIGGVLSVLSGPGGGTVVRAVFS